MTDIVERLRDKCDRKFINALCEDAAAEIERLRTIERAAITAADSLPDFGYGMDDGVMRALLNLRTALKDTKP